MSETTAEAVPNEYIVSFKRYTPEEVFQGHLQWAQAAHAEATAQRAESDGPAPTGVGKTFAFHDWYGYIGSFDKSLKAQIEARDEVYLVEPNYIVKLDGKQTQKPVPSWGLARVSSIQKLPNPPVNLPYIYDDTAGEGVTAYVVDTGILINHDDFGGRARWGNNFIDSSNTDGNGHGTHVAGTIGGTNYGVAKKATLVAVKVLGDDGYGSLGGIIQGIEWVVNDARNAGRLNKSVANFSLTSSPPSSALNSAVASAVNAGLFIAVAAGNYSQDASGYSPASEPLAYTVGSTDSGDSASWFSNYGRCLDIYAPGSDITSAWNSPGTSGSNTISGTSMATPHVVGLAACLIAQSPTLYNTPSAIGSGLTALAIKNSRVTPPIYNTISYLAYNGS